jgi:hypothetical protein
MAFERQLNAFGGMILVGGTLFAHADALAYGQQWRPAPGYAAAAVGSNNRIANMPNFRPHTSARQSRHRPYSRIEQRPYRQRTHRPAPQQFTGWQGYPLPGAANPYSLGLHLPRPGYFAATYPGPGWGMPFTGTAQPWRQPPAPMFARQYAWRPAQQPWVARAPVSQADDYRVRMAPTFVGYRPAGPAYAPPAGSWRPPVWQAPAARPQLSNQSHVTQHPYYAAGQQGASTTVRPAVPWVPGSRVAGPNPAPVGLGGGYWRPHAAAPAASRHPGGPFRPHGYGRSLAAKKEAASRTNQELGFTRDNLPGWVTTYQDSGYESSCGWCYGS